MKVAIVGSRDFTDRDAIFKGLLLFGKPLDTIVSGGARGADTIGEAIANEFGVPTIIHLPEWDKYGKSAGYRRNELIVRDADIVLAFFAPGPRSKGTTHTVNLAITAGKTVHIYHEGTWS